MKIGSFAIMTAILSASISSSLGAHATSALMDPNLPYCTGPSGGGSPWCGYRTMEQCKEAASGTGHECIVNAWMNASEDGGVLYGNTMAGEPRHAHKRR